MTPAKVELLTGSELAKDRPWFVGIFESMNYAISRLRIENYVFILERCPLLERLFKQLSYFC
ncbi:hypothetical protein SU69_01860 [Thermosipho melanesiensis]|uniref:Uncharacterized protein n=3 Tax=Thermosipho melanesiensis TaxID=46541 RepID=A6LJX5_THEM4|nr:hypothetical protein Tmel_0356 [Thermosipho melanesiensis BI429]APT74805.1 hypothetical protein BW47_01925 [Thermosipho melanesiensis]OOC37360.1 hypothetical protein SU68_01870 [Thermosipho melanesiensis]OOC39722.1 hypothetical protein SU69_01860 [Thermosipho melanesiensis]OOC39827.1 hypothetical protein SU70_01855 [Thermosipho melanesiensis]